MQHNAMAQVVHYNQEQAECESAAHLPHTERDMVGNLHIQPGSGALHQHDWPLLYIGA
jgi:hypothetical protein